MDQFITVAAQDGGVGCVLADFVRRPSSCGLQPVVRHETSARPAEMKTSNRASYGLSVGLSCAPQTAHQRSSSQGLFPPTISQSDVFVRHFNVLGRGGWIRSDAGLFERWTRVARGSYGEVFLQLLVVAICVSFLPTARAFQRTGDYVVCSFVGGEPRASMSVPRSYALAHGSLEILDAAAWFVVEAPKDQCYTRFADDCGTTCSNPADPGCDFYASMRSCGHVIASFGMQGEIMFPLREKVTSVFQRDGVELGHHYVVAPIGARLPQVTEAGYQILVCQWTDVKTYKFHKTCMSFDSTSYDYPGTCLLAKAQGVFDQAVASLVASQTDEARWRKVELVRAGVEQNPGPPKGAYSMHTRRSTNQTWVIPTVEGRILASLAKSLRRVLVPPGRFILHWMPVHEVGTVPTCLDDAVRAIGMPIPEGQSLRCPLDLVEKGYMTQVEGVCCRQGDWKRPVDTFAPIWMSDEDMRLRGVVRPDFMSNRFFIFIVTRSEPTNVASEVMHVVVAVRISGHLIGEFPCLDTTFHLVDEREDRSSPECRMVRLEEPAAPVPAPVPVAEITEETDRDMVVHLYTEVLSALSIRGVKASVHDEESIERLLSTIRNEFQRRLGTLSEAKATLIMRAPEFLEWQHLGEVGVIRGLRKRNRTEAMCLLQDLNSKSENLNYGRMGHRRRYIFPWLQVAYLMSMWLSCWVFSMATGCVEIGVQVALLSAVSFVAFWLYGIWRAVGPARIETVCAGWAEAKQPARSANDLLKECTRLVARVGMFCLHGRDRKHCVECVRPSVGFMSAWKSVEGLLWASTPRVVLSTMSVGFNSFHPLVVRARACVKYYCYGVSVDGALYCHANTPVQVERAFYARQAGYLTTTQPSHRRFLADFKRCLPKYIKTMSLETYLTSIGPRTAAKMRAILPLWTEWTELPFDQVLRAIKFNVFGKHEKLLRGAEGTKDTRIISYLNSIFTLETGPTIQALYAALGHAWDVNHFITLGSGLTPSLLGRWFTQVAELHATGDYVLLSTDVSKCDAHQNLDCYKCFYEFVNHMWYRCAGAKRVMKIIKAHATAPFCLPGGKKAIVPGTLRSGSTFTTLMNSLVNAFILYSAARDAGATEHTCRIIVAGDDGLLLLHRTCYERLKLSAIAKSFGHVFKASVVTPIDATFLSSHFWPVQAFETKYGVATWKIAPIFTRVLAKCAWSNEPKVSATWLIEVCQAYAAVFSGVPGFQRAFATVPRCDLELSGSHTLHSESPAGRQMFVARYGIEPELIPRGIVLRRVNLVPHEVPWLLACCQFDQQFAL